MTYPVSYWQYVLGGELYPPSVLVKIFIISVNRESMGRLHMIFPSRHLNRNTLNDEKYATSAGHKGLLIVNTQVIK